MKGNWPETQRQCLGLPISTYLPHVLIMTIGPLLRNYNCQAVKLRRRVLEIRRTRRTCPANFGNVRRRALVKFNQMSGEKLQMSGEAQKNFAYSAQAILDTLLFALPRSVVRVQVHILERIQYCHATV